MISQIMTPDWSIFLCYPSALLFPFLSFFQHRPVFFPFSSTKVTNTDSTPCPAFSLLLSHFPSLFLITSITTVSQAMYLTGNGSFREEIRPLMLLIIAICGLPLLLPLLASLSIMCRIFVKVLVLFTGWSCVLCQSRWYDKIIRDYYLIHASFY